MLHPKRYASDVAQELVEGLQNGTVVLEADQPAMEPHREPWWASWVVVHERMVALTNQGLAVIVIIVLGALILAVLKTAV